jgi:uncharacterized protein (TIGR03437 family)
MTNPAARGLVVTIILTGAGQTTPPGIDGNIENMSQEVPKQTVTAKIDGRTAEVPQLPRPLQLDGTMMAQVKVPYSAGTSNAVPVVITVGDASSPAIGAAMWGQITVNRA